MASSQYDPLAAELRRAQAVQARYTDMLLAKPQVVGVALGYTTPPKAPIDQPRAAQPRQVCIVVMVDRLIPPEQQTDADRIPAELDGIPVEVQVSGTFTAGFSAG
jgi:hypothetical protein